MQGKWWGPGAACQATEQQNPHRRIRTATFHCHLSCDSMAGYLTVARSYEGASVVRNDQSRL